MKLEILLSGYGGQGLMSLGRFIANLATIEGKYTLWLPSYGAEVRGGTAYCFIKISDKPILSLLINKPEVAIIFNQQSLDRFEKVLKRNGILILNSNLLTRKPYRSDIKIFSFPFNEIALECKNIKVANTVALGLFLKLTNIFNENVAIGLLKKAFKDQTLIYQNIEAFKRGLKLIN